MASSVKDHLYIHVEDETGQHFYCPIDMVQNRGDMEDDDFFDCVEEGAVHRYSGHVIVQSHIDLKKNGKH